jgi:hypothetical protein
MTTPSYNSDGLDDSNFNFDNNLDSGIGNNYDSGNRDNSYTTTTTTTVWILGERLTSVTCGNKSIKDAKT